MSGDSKGGGTQSAMTQQSLPGYAQHAQQNLLNAGGQMTGGFLGNPAFSVAGLNPDQTQAFDLARDMAQRASEARIGDPTPIANADHPSIGSPSQASFAGLPEARVANYNSAGPASQAAFHSAGPAAQAAWREAQMQQLRGGDYKEFLNPYTTEVVNTTLDQMRREKDETSAQIGARAAAAGSFGGSREAVQRSQLDRSFGEQVASTTANLMAQGYDKATATAMANVQLRQQTELANQSEFGNTSRFNVGQTNQQNQFNAGQQNQVGMFNTGQTNERDQFSNNLQNQIGMFNVGQTNDFARTNQAQQNALSQFNSGQANSLAAQQAQLNAAASQFNAGSANTINAANANRQMQERTLLQTQQQQALQNLLGIGGQQQQQMQAGLDVPWTALQRLMGITPGQYGSTEVKTVPDNSPSQGQRALGGALAGAALGTKALPGWGTAAGGLLGGVGGYFA